jgi:cell fate (sporulation/competence/biofilm development) regulator YlbF (YheA/YmcA/DUF963 family)
MQDNPITRKTKELCQAILDQPDLQTARKHIETFLADAPTRGQYEGLLTKGRALQEKQQSSTPLTAEEISAFEKDRESLLANPVAQGFFAAQEELHHIHESINVHVSKTLELGRLPTEADLDGDGCGGHGGCGCGHDHDHGHDHGHGHSH